MINQELLTYIENEIKKGTSKNIIQSNLLSNGWNERDVSEGFSNIIIKNYDTDTVVSSINSVNAQNIKQTIIQDTKYIQTKAFEPKKTKSFPLILIVILVILS